MSEQHALFSDPHWTDRLTAGDRVRNTSTGRRGTVRQAVPGRHVLILWDPTDRWPANVCRHGSPLGLSREDA